MPAPDELVEGGAALDASYVPARYPNGHDEGAPLEHYGPVRRELGAPSCPSPPRSSSVKRWPSAGAVLSALEARAALAADRRADLLALGYFGFVRPRPRGIPQRSRPGPDPCRRQPAARGASDLLANVRRHQSRTKRHPRPVAAAYPGNPHRHRTDPGHDLTPWLVAVAHHSRTTVRQSTVCVPGP